MKIKLKSSYPCLVKTEKESFDLDENDVLNIENENRLFVYPVSYSNKNIPFYINLKDLKNCNRYEIFDIDDFKLILLKENEKIVSYNKESLNFENDTCEIFIYPNSIKFENKSYAVKYDCPQNYKNYKVFKLDSFACVEFDNDNLYCFNMKNNKLTHFQGDEIEFEKNILKLRKSLNDCEDRIRKTKYEFINGAINTLDANYAHSNKNFDKNMTPYRFLEALKVKDYSFAKVFLSEGLSKKIDEQTLSKFLGNIHSFLPLSTEDFIVLSNESKNFVRFYLENEKISDISVDNLWNNPNKF